MKVTIEFNVDSLEEIQPALVKGGENLVRALQTENERLRLKVAALESTAGLPGTEEPVAGDLDSSGTPFDPVIHTGTRTVKGAWRVKRGVAPTEPKPAITEAPAAPAELPKSEAPAAPAKPKAGMSLDEFRAGVNKVVNTHKDGVEAGKKFAKSVLLAAGYPSMKDADPAKYEEILASMQSTSDGEDGL